MCTTEKNSSSSINEKSGIEVYVCSMVKRSLGDYILNWEYFTEWMIS